MHGYIACRPGTCGTTSGGWAYAPTASKGRQIGSGHIESRGKTGGPNRDQTGTKQGVENRAKCVRASTGECVLNVITHYHDDGSDEDAFWGHSISQSTGRNQGRALARTVNTHSSN